MKDICVQIQPDLSQEISKEEVLTILESEGFSPVVEEGDDKGVYINFHIRSDNLKGSWTKIKSSLISKIRDSDPFIVVCEGKEGWDDYLLLHHFDKSEKLDVLETDVETTA